MNEPIWLLKPVMLAMHSLMIAEFGGDDGIRDEGLLDSALSRPVNLFNYKPDATLPELASSYAAGVLQNHPFVDGNKRSGFMAAYVFLGRNGLMLVADEMSATTMTYDLAASAVDESDYAAWLTAHVKR